MVSTHTQIYTYTVDIYFLVLEIELVRAKYSTELHPQTCCDISKNNLEKKITHREGEGDQMNARLFI